jgi:SAM-dependent methyltransferase
LSEGFIQTAREKAAARGLDHLAIFQIGDGNALDFHDVAFDLVFCSGAPCAFYHNGLREFHHVLKPGGRCAITDVVWRQAHVPPEVVERWTGGIAHILTLAGNCAAFERGRFRLFYAQEHHQPTWWQAYYQDRGDAGHWIEERDNYLRDQKHLGLGLWVIQKE